MDPAMILFNYFPFQNGNFSYRKEFAPRGSKFFPLRAVPYGMINLFYRIGWPPLIVTILITQVRTHLLNCVMGATLMPLYPNVFFLLVWYNKFGITNCTHLGVSGYNSQKSIVYFCLNRVDPDEMQHYAAFHLDLHCLQKYSFKGFTNTKG